MTRCADHLDFTDSACKDCGLPVDSYGNTENQFDYCAFPNCGCDGARLCMAGSASELAMGGNVEGMWSLKTPKQRKAVFSLVAVCANTKETTP